MKYLKVWEEKYHQPRILCPVTLSFIIDEDNFLRKNKFGEFGASRPPWRTYGLGLLDYGLGLLIELVNLYCKL